MYDLRYAHDGYTVKGIGKFRGDSILGMVGIYVVFCWNPCRFIWDIGKTYDQDFVTRLKQHEYYDNYFIRIQEKYGMDAALNTDIIVGILKEKVSKERIADIEHLLIFHIPTELNKKSTKTLRCSRDLTVVNTGNYFPLAPIYHTPGFSRYTPSFSR